MKYTTEEQLENLQKRIDYLEGVDFERRLSKENRKIVFDCVWQSALLFVVLVGLRTIFLAWWG